MLIPCAPTAVALAWGRWLRTRVDACRTPARPPPRQAGALSLMLLLCTAPGWTWGQSPPTPLAPCRIEGFATELQCGAIKRALDPARPAGVQIDLHFVVAPALARRKWPDPVFVLAGGPGQSAIRLAPELLARWRRLNNRRDLVFVDQRGCGRSAPLRCGDDRDQPLAQQLDVAQAQAQLRQCLAELQKLPYGDLRYFTTTLAMQDLDAVRQVLGVAQINLVGVSYGTRAALEFLRLFPAQVRRVVLDGVAPPDMVLPASMATDSQTALDAVFFACNADAACARRYPRLRTEWHQLLASLPRELSLADPLTGRREHIMLTRQMLLGAVRGPLYAPALAAALPEALHQAARGHWEGLMGLVALMRPRGADRLAEGMYFSVICAEDAPRLPPEPQAAAPDFGQMLAQQVAASCAIWPRGEVPPAFYSLPASRAPVLLLSGGLDPATPPRHGQRVAQALGRQARHVAVANAGHGVLALPCMTDVLYRFIDAEPDSEALALDAGCAQAMPRPPVFAPVQAVQAEPAAQQGMP